MKTTKTLQSMAINETITIQEKQYKSFCQIKSRLFKKGIGKWKMKRNFNNEIEIKRIL